MTYKLCYIDGPWAFFTTKPLTGEGRQWGDDWNDAPYEHNAGDPYDDGTIVCVAFKCGSLRSPDDRVVDKCLSVESINSGITPWLAAYNELRGPIVFAGATLDEFIVAVERAGGTVYQKGNLQ